MPIREEFDDQGETKKIGAKKARKLEMKEEKRAQREVCVKKVTCIRSTLKGTVSDKKNLQTALQIKKNTFQSQHVPFFSKNHIILTEKYLFMILCLFYPFVGGV